MIRFLFADGPFGLGRSFVAEEESGRGNSELLADEGGREEDIVLRGRSVAPRSHAVLASEQAMVET